MRFMLYLLCLSLVVHLSALVLVLDEKSPIDVFFYDSLTVFVDVYPTLLPPMNSLISVQCSSEIHVFTSVGLSQNPASHSFGSHFSFFYDACLYQSGFSILDGLFLKLVSSSPSTTCSVSLTTVPALLEPPFPLSLNISSNPNDLYYFLIPPSGSDFVHVQTSGTSSVLIGNGCPLRYWSSSFQCYSSSCKFLVPNSLSSWVAVSSSNHEFSITISSSDDVSSNCTVLNYLTIVIALTCILRKCISIYRYVNLVTVSLPFVILGFVLVGDFLSALFLLSLFLILLVPYSSLLRRYRRFLLYQRISNISLLCVLIYPIIGYIWSFGYISSLVNLSFRYSCYQFNLFFFICCVWYVLVIRKLFKNLALEYRSDDDYDLPCAVVQPVYYEPAVVDCYNPVDEFQVLYNSSSD
ncbi:hypothetical protein GEMRC1_013493 [Eukaryota sp. GEM-RC1]